MSFSLSAEATYRAGGACLHCSTLHSFLINTSGSRGPMNRLRETCNGYVRNTISYSLLLCRLANKPGPGDPFPRPSNTRKSISLGTVLKARSKLQHFPRQCLPCEQLHVSYTCQTQGPSPDIVRSSCSHL